MKIKSNRGKAVYIQPPLISKEDWHKDKVGLARLYGEDFVGSPHYDSSSESTQVAKEFELICNKLAQLSCQLNPNSDSSLVDQFKTNIIQRINFKTGTFSKYNDKQIKAFKIDLEILISNVVRTEDMNKLLHLMSKLRLCEGAIVDTTRMLGDEYTTPCGLWPALTKIRVNVKDTLSAHYLRAANLREGVHVHMPIVTANLAEFYGIPMMDTPIPEGGQRFPDDDNEIRILGSPGKVSIPDSYLARELNLFSPLTMKYFNNFYAVFFKIFDAEVVGGLADNLDTVLKEKFAMAVSEPATLLDNLRALLLSEYQISNIHENFLLAPLDINNPDQPPKLLHNKTLRYWCHALSAHALELNGVAEPYPRTQINVDPQLDLVKLEGLEYFVSGNRILHPCEVIALGAQQGLLDKIMAALNESPKIFYFEMAFALELARQAALDNGEEFECQTTIHDLLFLAVEFGTAQQVSDLTSLHSFSSLRDYQNENGETILRAMILKMDEKWEKVKTQPNEMERTNATRHFVAQFTHDDIDKLTVLIEAENDPESLINNDALCALAWDKRSDRCFALMTKNNVVTFTQEQIKQLIYLSLVAGNSDLFDNCLQRNESKLDVKNSGGMTFLHHAAARGRGWAVTKLLDIFPSEMISAKNNEAKTALEFAIEGKHLRVVELILAHPKFKISSRRIAFCFGAAKSVHHSEILVKLIEKFTPDQALLEWAIDHKDWKVLLALAKKNFDTKHIFDVALQNKTKDWMKIAYFLLDKVALTARDFFTARSIGQIDLAANILKRLVANKTISLNTKVVLDPDEDMLPIDVIATNREWDPSFQKKSGLPLSILRSPFELDSWDIKDSEKMISHLKQGSMVDIRLLPVDVMKYVLQVLKYPEILLQLNHYSDEEAAKIRHLVIESGTEIDCIYTMRSLHLPLLNILMRQPNFNPNQLGDNGHTFLSFLISNHFSQLVTDCLARDNLEINFNNAAGQTTLQIIAQQTEQNNTVFCLDNMVKLIEQGADLSGNFGTPPTPLLDYAVGKGHERLIATVLERIPTPDFSQRFSSKNTQGVLTDLAIHENWSQVLNICLSKNNFNVNERGKRLRNPLHMAVLHRRDEARKILLASDAVNPDEKDAFGQTPLQIALSNNDIDTMIELINHGANIKWVPTPGGIPFLHWVIQKKQGKMVNFMLKRESPLLDDLMSRPDLYHLYKELGHKYLCEIYQIEPNSNLAFKLYAQSYRSDLISQGHKPTEYKLCVLQQGIEEKEKTFSNSLLLTGLNNFKGYLSESEPLKKMPEPLKERFFLARK